MCSQPSPDKLSAFRRLFPELASVLAGWFSDADLEGLTDEEVATNFADSASAREVAAVLSEGKRMLAQEPELWREMADYANRYFHSSEQARAWLTSVLEIIELKRQRRGARIPQSGVRP